ncbi:carboxymuconolactone decarboxylase family protein [Hellea balneolensis]|uniref:carboxymuconolactone decarboxylase family protein n=1 Tax=Hellea balneolensis TaxID=287478 RepID=UPI00040868A8|nr:carboxymuconolactone decarboxylase family protein [Hellea balneolensis]
MKPSHKTLPDLLADGEKKRRKVLGDAHVDNAMTNAHPFNQPLQEIITTYGWGDIWTREGLSDKTRSLLNVALLTAMRQTNELKGHTRGAINNGCTPEEIREVIIHTCLYAGAPAALSAMKVVSATLQELDCIKE